MRAEEDAVARLDCEVAVKIPVAVRLVAEAFWSDVSPVAVSLEIVVVARVEVPVTTKVLVVVLFVVVRLVKNAVSAVKILAKRLDDVAFVVDALVAKKLVAVALEIVADEIVVVARVEAPVTVSVPPSTVLPDTVSAVAEAVVSVD